MTPLQKITFWPVIFVSVTMLLLPWICHAQSEHRDAKVEALLGPLGTADKPSEVRSPDKLSEDYQHMIAKLQHPDAQTLQLLMDEVRDISILEKGHTNLSWSAANRVYRLHTAFEITGTNAVPLLPELKSEFLSGDSINAATVGLVAIGEDAWPVLLQGLTNSNPKVQLAAASVMGYAKGTNALLAFPYLCNFATNSAESFWFRMAATESIGDIAVGPQIKIPVLVHIAKLDPDVSIRCTAIKAIGQTGVYSDDIRKFLERIGKDANEHIRVAVTTALQELKK